MKTAHSGSKNLVFSALTLFASAMLTNASVAVTPPPPGNVTNWNGWAQQISYEAAQEAHVKQCGWRWQDMGMNNFASGTGAHGDYAYDHTNTLRALRSGAVKVSKYGPDMTDGSTGVLSFPDLAKLIISNAYARTIFYSLPNQYRPFYKAHWGNYGNAGRPWAPFDYDSANFPKLSNDNPDGTVNINNCTMNASDMQHWQYNYAYALAQPEFSGQYFVTVPSIKDATGKPIPLDVSVLAKQFLKQEAMSAAGQLRVIMPLGQSTASWNVPPTVCQSMYGERATARTLATLVRAYKVKSIFPEDVTTAMNFVNKIIIPCYLDKGPAAHVNNAAAAPLPTLLPPILADSGLYYANGPGTAQMAAAIYEAAKILGNSNKDQAEKLMKIAQYKARWVNELISVKKSPNGVPAMPWMFSFYNASDIISADGTPVLSLAEGINTGKITPNYAEYSAPYYWAGYSVWSYTAVRIAEEFGEPGAKENADKILAAAKQCLLKNTGDLCEQDKARSIIGFVVEPDGSSKLVDAQGKFIP